jgi:aminopeptidase N
VRGVAASDEIMKTQLDRLTNADRKARFAVRDAGALARDAGPGTVLHEPEGRQEPGPRGLGARRHSFPAPSAPRRGVEKVRPPALELTWEIKRTGDIFFPKRWADTTLSGYQSVQTAAEVRALIEALPPDYPPRLRWVLQSAADPLFRAAKLLNR